MVTAVDPVGTPAAADIRIALALRPHIRAYRVAERVGINPVVLSRIVNGRQPVGFGLALLIHAAILAEDAGMAEAVE